ncbi:MAG: prepilin-type N-terminal cleavage/methylation domain-containing protein [bacterium]|nr:prepilin-type N-terminal cleavage/methylation domain-containing protein [bacterium]
MKNKKKNKGSSLVEVLIALAIVLLVIIALARGVTTAIKSSEASKRGIQAASYAQEGMENIRAFRDAGWTQFYGYVTSNNGINRDFTGTVPSSSNCPASANILDIFTRCVKFESTANPDKFKATVTVSWTDGSGTHASILISYFTKSTNWAVVVPDSVPPPVLAWIYVGRFNNVGCGWSNTVNFNARQMKIQMLPPPPPSGGPDCRISFFDLGSTGAWWTAGGTDYYTYNDAAEDDAMQCGWVRYSVDFGSLKTVNKQNFRVGCNDGESADFDIWRFGN